MRALAEPAASGLQQPQLLPPSAADGVLGASTRQSALPSAIGAHGGGGGGGVEEGRIPSSSLPVESVSRQDWQRNPSDGAHPFDIGLRGGQASPTRGASLAVGRHGPEVAPSPGSPGPRQASTLVERCGMALQRLEAWWRRTGEGGEGDRGVGGSALKEMQQVLVEMCALIEEVVLERDEAVRLAVVFEEEVRRLQAHLAAARAEQVSECESARAL